MPHNPAREHLLAALLESMEDAVLGIALDSTIQSWSQGAERLYGYTAAEMTGQSLKSLLPSHEGRALEALLADAGQATFGGWETTERLRKDGSRLAVVVKRIAVQDALGGIVGILETARTQHSSQSISPAETDLRLLVEQMPAILWTTDQRLRITSNWGSGLPSSKIHPGALVGQSVFEYLKCADRYATPIAQHYDALHGVSSRCEYKRKNRVLDIRLQPLRSASGEIIGCLGVGLDITDRKKNEEEALHQATHDALTGLANYREFVDTLEREVRRAERSRHPFTILLLDLDDLKRVNDRLGHLAGNRALQRLAAMMKEHCRATDLAARYGGDEFGVVLIDSDQRMAEHVAQRIETCLRNDREEPPLTVSIGIGVYPDDGRTAQALLQAADRQLYRRKKASHSRTMAAR
jgi:diguanylate cyclase (GGDEF)-like protein/PAS domain S-box-containing protein